MPPEVWKLYCAVEFVSVVEILKFVNIEVESLSQIPSLRLKRRHAALCTHYIDDLLPHVPLPLCSYWGYGQEFHYMPQLSNEIKLVKFLI
jgi:hypothetical protein